MTLLASRGDYRILGGAENVDLGAVHAALAESYWAKGVTRSLLERAVSGSLCFSVYRDDVQVGFARVITDAATFAYLSDVYIDAVHQGRGLGQWLVETVRAHPHLQGLRRFALVTRDAHGLYARAGFAPLAAPERHMEIVSQG
jgi:GNAT superfamily N-acetyltransferase